MLRLRQIGRIYSCFISKIFASYNNRIQRAAYQQFKKIESIKILPARRLNVSTSNVRQRTRPKKCDPKIEICECDNKIKEEKPKSTKCSNDKAQKTNKNSADKTSKGNPCKGKQNMVAVLYKQQDLRLEEREKPTPCPGEVLIAMDSVGISSSDVSYFNSGKVQSPMVLGRYGVGIVAKLGQGVRTLSEGDRVVIEPDIPCRQCDNCKSCHYHLCSQMNSIGITPYDGLLACYHVHDADYCHKLPDNITMEEGVMMGMLAAGINVCSRCPLCIGSSMLVVGAGPMGIISLIAAKAMGATNTCIMCKFKKRLELAEKFGAKTVMICDGATPEDMAQTVREVLGCAPGVTVDSVGSEISLKLAIASTASGGSIVLSAISSQDVNIPLKEIAQRDLSLKSALRHSKKYEAAVALAGSGSINLKPLISHHFFFEEAAKAFTTMLDNQDTVNKVVVHIRPQDRNNKSPF